MNYKSLVQILRDAIFEKTMSCESLSFDMDDLPSTGLVEGLSLVCAIKLTEFIKIFKIIKCKLSSNS